MASSTFWRNARCLATGAGIGVFGTQVVSQAAGKNPLFDSHTVPGLGRRLPGREERAKKGPTVLPVIRMAGTIEAPRPGQVSSQSISLQKYEDVFIQAFRLKPPAVVIEMNSPGGSPAQSSLIHARLLELRKQHPDVKLLCYVSEMCASGGYYIASACDEIHVIPSSVVGSIGVQALNIGVVELFKKWGLEDRTMTAGTSKNSDSPFKPRDPVAVQKTARMLEEIHQDFKIKVAAGRGERLRHGDAAAYARQVGDYKSRSERREALFDGSVFLGRKAVEFGLADGLYEDMVASLQERFGEDVRLLELKTKQGLFERLQDMQAARAAEHAAALARAARAELANRL